jgi:PAS domain S-box-containing protein
MKKRIELIGILAFNIQSLRTRIALSVAAWVAYLIAFFSLYYLVGAGANALAAIPVILTGWLLGFRAGLLSGLLALPLNLLLFYLVRYPELTSLISFRSMPPEIAMAVIGAVVGMLRDLSERLKLQLAERRRAEEALRNAAEEWQRTFDTISDMIMLVDPQNRIIRANRAMAMALGLPCQELLGRYCFECVHGTDAPPGFCPHVQTLLDGEEHTAEVYEPSLGRDFLVTTTPLPDDSGIPIGTVHIMRDITERKWLEVALRESERIYRDTFETAPIGIFHSTFDGKFIKVNPSLAKMLGYESPDELISVVNASSVAEQLYVYPERRSQILGEVLEREGWPVYENLYRRKDGRIITATLIIRTVRNDDGSPSYLEGFVEDITERKRAEEEIDNLAKFPAEDPAPVLRLARDGTVLYTNQSSRPLLRLWGCEVGQRLPEDWRELILESLATVLSKEIEVECGDTIYSLVLTPIVDAGYVNIYGKDITKRKRMEEALRESEERLNFVLEGSQQGFADWNIETGEVRRNERWAEMLGYTLQEIESTVGQWMDLIHPEDRAAAWKSVQDHLEGRTPMHESEYRMLTKTGQYKWILDRAMIVKRDPQGRPLRISGTHTDVTERKRLEERLQRHAAELEEANEELKDFAYIVSHDLRAPLASIKGFSDVLSSIITEESKPILDKCLPQLDEEERAKLTTAFEEEVPLATEYIGASVKRMDGLINAILKLARLGRRDLNLEPIDTESLVQSILRSMAHQIEQRSVRVTVGALPEVVADQVSMGQIMGNLLDNALKYLEPGRPGEIEISAERSPQEITFHIRDNGRGIAQKDIPRVFDLFQRVGKPGVSGEGMGLTFVRTLIRRHGGRIWCESKPGAGTTFSFTIPKT